MLNPLNLKRVFISLSDKSGLPELVLALKNHGVEIVSTGGTAKAIEDLGTKVRRVEEITGFPEAMGGRVKTLHPAIHAGILQRAEDTEFLHKMGIEAFQAVIVNLYPFASILHEGLANQEAIEFIDIGGPSMLRGAAKNYLRCVPVCDPADYPELIGLLEQHSGSLPQAFCEKMSCKTFAHTAHYDSLISQYFAKQHRLQQTGKTKETLPLGSGTSLRYGENPHQQASLFKDSLATGGIAQARVLYGKALSYNNLLDADAAWNLASSLGQGSCCIIKHTIPCGAALGQNPLESYSKAFSGNPTAAFGGVIAFHAALDAAILQHIFANQFVEVVICSGLQGDVSEVMSFRKNVRLVVAEACNSNFEVRKISGGYLKQESNSRQLNLQELEWQVGQAPESQQTQKDIELAWSLVKEVKSNAIVLCQDSQSIGIAGGYTSRIEAVKSAIRQALDFGFRLEGCVLASDAFFPFRDNIDALAGTGVKYVIQPGGSVRDKEVVEACREHAIAMAFTGFRVFKH